MEDENKKWLRIENELLLTKSKAMMIDLYIKDEKEIIKLNRELDLATEICNNKQVTIVKLSSIINELEKLIEQYSKNDYYYKYNGKYLKSEIINDLKKLKEGK